MAEHDLESHAEHADQLRARVAEKGLTERERRLGYWIAWPWPGDS